MPTKGYDDMLSLYTAEDHNKGEVALCSLAGAVPANIKDDEEYEDVTYYALLMIDKCIHKNEYTLPHLSVTAKSRLNAGVGIVGLAHMMAKHRMKYSTPEGKQFIHWIAERHMFMCIKSSLRLAKELGPAPWIHKTKWVDGWLPIDTYEKAVDEVVENNLMYPWEEIRKDIIATGGIRNSCLVAHMPAETSSKASGTTNGIYPVRSLSQLKGDSDTVIRWAAPDSDVLGQYYESAYDISIKDHVDVYAVIQKFTDQAISADVYHKLYKDTTVGSTEILKNYFYMTKMGLKSRYYVNMKTSEGVQFEEVAEDAEAGCAGGACTL